MGGLVVFLLQLATAFAAAIGVYLLLALLVKIFATLF